MLDGIARSLTYSHREVLRARHILTWTTKSFDKVLDAVDTCRRTHGTDAIRAAG